VAVALITGSTGLIGSEATKYFAGLGLDVLGVDNDMRQIFFGPDASTAWNRSRLESEVGAQYRHHDLDVRDRDAIFGVFARYGTAIALVIHAAAQPSHDWAAREPLIDFEINAVGTLNVLEATRRYAPEAIFIFTSTNKVYGDRPNFLPLVELDSRWEIDPSHEYADGIREDMPIDMTLHSLFGVSKASADLLVQEYGRYFGIRSACFRGGTLTGPQHSATELHGFLAYVMRCAMTNAPYKIYGYQGKQVRDAIHSNDVIRAFHEFFLHPRIGEVYNIGGGRFSNSSVIEAIQMSEEITGQELTTSYTDSARTGDHIWWIGSNSHFQEHFPTWRLHHDVREILEEIYEANQGRWGHRAT
jgi:CDP-paratose 2-epimerase